MKRLFLIKASSFIFLSFLATGCAGTHIPGGRDVSIPSANPPIDRQKALNEERDPVTKIRLGDDVLLPHAKPNDPLPNKNVGPYELRLETLASALQMVLDDEDMTLAFETDKAMTTKISITNLHGKLQDVVNQICDSANLYCTFKNKILTVKEAETFIVDMPPLGTTSTEQNSSGSTTSSTQSSTTSGSTAGSGAEPWADYTHIVAGLQAIIGEAPTIDDTTRVMVYTATPRAQKNALEYFSRIRKNMAMIIFDINIWEVTLNNENRTGIDWSALWTTGNYKFNFKFPGPVPTGTGTATPITISPSFTGSASFNPAAILGFISEQGSVKTISQPQLTVLSGATASLSVTQVQKLITQVSRTPAPAGSGQADTFSITPTDVPTGLTLSLSGSWHDATIYGTLAITLSDLLKVQTFSPNADNTVQLPTTSSRNLSTQIRVRPGDAILIGGLVSQKDSYAGSGPGFMKPLFTTARDAAVVNTELVFLLRPRVVVYDMGSTGDTPEIVESNKNGYIPSLSDERENKRPEAFFKKGERFLPKYISPAALAPQPEKMDRPPKNREGVK